MPLLLKKRTAYKTIIFMLRCYFVNNQPILFAG